MACVGPIFGGKNLAALQRGHRELDLDVVRGVAILLAMGWHFNPVSGVPIVDVLLWPGRTLGWAGVDLFFVLSGFLVGRIMLRERLKTGAFDRWRFMKRRAFKLWPVLYVYLLAEVLFGDNGWETFLIQNIVHLQNYLGTSLAQLWSLAVEEHFYLIVAVLFPLFIKRSGTPRTLVVVMVSVLLTCLVLRVFGVKAGMSDVEIQWQTHFRVDALAAGVLLAILCVHYERSFARLLQLRLLWLTVTVLGIACLAILPRPGILSDTVGYTVAYVSAASFMLLLYRSQFIAGARWAFRPIGHLGVYSYGLYIWHAAAGGLIVAVLGAVPLLSGFSDSPLAVAGFKYAAAISVGIVMTLAVEWPFLRLRDRLVPSAGVVLVDKTVSSHLVGSSSRSVRGPSEP